MEGMIRACVLLVPVICLVASHPTPEESKNQLGELNFYLATDATKSCPNYEKSQNDTVMQPIRALNASKSFAFKWFKAVLDSNQERSDENIVISPLSMQYVFSLVLNALSDPQAIQEIEETVFSKMTRDQVTTLFTNVSGQFNARKHFSTQGNYIYPADGSSTMHVFNGIVYNNKRIRLDNNYKKMIKNCFGAATINSNTIEQVVSIVNKITNIVTRGMIDKAIDTDVRADDSVLFVNALFFNATWQSPFSKENVQQNKFFVPKSKSPVETTFMTTVGVFPFYEDNDVKVIALDYKGGQQTMYFILPVKNLAIFEQQLSEEKLESWMNQLQETEVILTIPKFEVKMNLDVRESMEAMDIGAIFNKTAFSAFPKADDNQDPISSINMIKQKIVLQVHEMGTTGAAVSTLSAVSTSAKPVFRANKPFMFYVHDKTTDSVMFIGRFTHPMKTDNSDDTM